MPALVMVPLDGSDKDARALAIAGAAAELTGGALHLVRVVEPGRGLHAEAAHALEAAADVGRAAGAPTTVQVLESDDVPGALLAHADARRAAVIVAGTRAPGPLGQLRGGSVADRLARSGVRPVLLVPPGSDYVAGLEPRLRRVLLPLDGSDQARAPLDLLRGLARARELALVLIEVVAPAHDGRAAAQRLHDEAARLRAAGLTVETHVVESPYPVEAITAAVRDFLVDAIAMGTRGRGGVARLLLGSVATGVVGRSEVPVLLVAPPA